MIELLYLKSKIIIKMSLPPLKSVKNINKILPSIKNKEGNPLLTKEQAKTLSKLKFKESKEIILTLEDRNFLYEIIWLISELGYEITYNFLTTDWEKVLGSHNIRKKMLFENPLLSKEREKFLVDMEIYRDKVDIEKGGANCPKCQSSSTMSINVQTRSGDEMTAIVMWCTDCKFKWYAQ